MEKTARKPRNPRIEVLRLVAIMAIAVFHTFQSWFAAAADPTSELAAVFPWLGKPLGVAALGCINLLGAYGNHVFYLISGYFLLPAGIQGRPLRLGRKTMTILASATFYAVLALLLSCVVPMESVSLHQTGWLLDGLEFIWVYLALILMTPVMALVAKRLPHWREAVVVLAVLVFGLNAYVAFFSPGEADRGLLEWRKLLSAASYLVAYLTGGALSGQATTSVKAKTPLVTVIVACLAVEGTLAFMGRADLAATTSFKSTSLLSYLLAVASLFLASASSSGEKPVPSWVMAAASSILGVYIAQSMTSDLWRPAFEDLSAKAAAAGALPALLLCGTVLSLALVTMCIVFDQLTRATLLKLLRQS